MFFNIVLLSSYVVQNNCWAVIVNLKAKNNNNKKKYNKFW